MLACIGLILLHGQDLPACKRVQHALVFRRIFIQNTDGLFRYDGIAFKYGFGRRYIHLLEHIIFLQHIADFKYPLALQKLKGALAVLFQSADQHFFHGHYCQP